LRKNRRYQSATASGAFLKNERDVHLFERLAFLSRRKV
jgi:hypothetical protein